MARLQNAYKEQELPEYYKMTIALISTLKGQQFDCVQMMQHFRSEWGIDEDHHWYAEAMDAMTRNSKAKLVKPGGFTVYEIL